MKYIKTSWVGMLFLLPVVGMGQDGMVNTKYLGNPGIKADELRLRMKAKTEAYVEIPATLETIQGQNARYSVLKEAAGIRGGKLSRNGRYLVVGISEEGQAVGLRYDNLNKTYFFTPDANPEYVTNDGSFAGAHYDSVSKQITAGLYKDGKWSILELPKKPCGPTSGYGGNASTYGISSDGKYISGMGFDCIPKLNNSLIYVTTYWEGSKLKKVYYPIDSLTTENVGGYGSRANDISADGKTILGFGRFGNTQRSPHVWKDGRTIALAAGLGLEYPGGEVQGSNADGSILMGNLSGQGMKWRKTSDSTYASEVIPPLAGWGSASMIAISEGGFSVGYTYTGMVTERTGMFHKEGIGSIDPNVYLYELYGLDLGERTLFTPMDVSSDGRTIVGFTAYTSGWEIFIIDLDPTMIKARPLSFIAKQKKGTMTVDMSWEKPLPCGRELLGYHIYCDSIKMNTEIIPITQTKYSLESNTAGAHAYTTTAVYADGESFMSKPVKLQIINVDGCYPIGSINTELIYNRYFSLRWGLPSANIAVGNIAVVGSPKYDAINFMLPQAGTILKSTQKESKTAAIIQPDLYDYVGQVDLQRPNALVYFTVKGVNYSSDWNREAITRYKPNGDVEETFRIENLPAVVSVVIVGDRTFVCCKSKFIYEIDLATKSIINQIPIAIESRYIAYIPTLDQGRGGFSVGGGDDVQKSIFVNMDGEKLEDGITYTAAMGTVYHNGKIYAYEQTGEHYNQIVEYDVATKKATGKVFDLYDLPWVVEMSGRNGSTAGGLSVATLEDSTICLVPVLQVTYQNNRAVYLELQAPKGLKGYNLYKNDIKLNTEPLPKRSYCTELVDAGDFTFKAEAVFANGCKSESAPAKVTINPIGTCHPVQHIKAEEINKSVFFTWEKPENNLSSGLVQFNVYRNNELLNKEDGVFVFSYVDAAVPVGTYNYRIESFYDNSCVSSDSIAVEVTHLGSFEAPALLHGKGLVNAENAKKFDVNLNWQLPYFEKPYPARYGEGVPLSSYGITTGQAVSMAIAWDTAANGGLAQIKDFQISGIELFLPTQATVCPFVIINNVFVYNKATTSRLRVNNFNTIIFDKPIEIPANAWEVVIGYTISDYDMKENCIVTSVGELVSPYGCLLSLNPTDLEAWSASGLNGNWCIAGLLTKERELSQEKKKIYAPGKESGFSLVAQASQKRSFLITTAAVPFNEPLLVKGAEPTLTGFKLYKDGALLTTNPITTLSYTDKMLDAGTYSYRVAAQYKGHDEVLGEEVLVLLEPTSNEESLREAGIILYPVPVSDILNVQGDYQNLSIYNLQGTCILGKQQKAQAISLRALAAGSYIVKIELLNGKTLTQKIVKL
ncbi:MAG: T9SS type A sorting domain-containing protein [Bacteroidales bacterium]